MIKFFTEHPTAANLLMAAFLLLGLLTVTGIKREAMPDFSTSTLQISATYSGASAVEIEEAVAVPIEEALESVNNIKNIKTTATEGSVVIRVEMLEGADYQQFYNDVKTEVEAISSFPEEVEDLIIEPYNRLDQVVSIAVYGDLSVTDLKAYCEDLKDKFMEIGGGIQVEISGFSQREFRIELLPTALHAYKLSVKDIADIISSQNIELPAGTLETGRQDIKLRFSDRRKSVAELKSIRILSSSGGGEILLGDIATISDNFTQAENKALFNGRRAGVLSISKSKSADSLTIYDQVMAVLEREKAEVPPGIDFAVTRNMASDIQDRLNMVYINALEGFLMVFAALWLFLNIRLSVWVAMGLPVSFLGGLFFMNLFGISLNMISTFALLIAIGLLMDDAIVISENIAVHLKAGAPPLQAAVNGAKEVGRGVLASFLTTICVFVPLISLSGQIGKILCVVPVTLIIILSVSLMEAFLVLPNHLAHSFRKGYPAATPMRRKIDQAIDYIRFTLVSGIVEKITPYRYLFLSAILGLFIISLALFPAGYLKFVVFPTVESDTVVCKVMLPPGTPLEESEKAAARLTLAAERMDAKLTPLQPGGRKLVKYISVNFSVNSDYSDSGPHLFTVYVDLLSGNERNSSVKTILQVWREEAGDIFVISSIKYEDQMTPPGGKSISIGLHGKNLDSLKQAALELQEKLASYAGVFDIADNLSSGKPELVMTLKPGTLKLGFTAESIARQLRAAYEGNKADELQIGSDNYEYNVRMRDSLSDNLRNFDNYQLTTTNGMKVPLAGVVNIRTERGPASISRYNGKRTVTISADVNEAQANAQEITQELATTFLPELQERCPGVSFSFGGQREASSETGGSVMRGFLIGIAGIFILLSLQFGKILEPLVVMATIPLAFIGAIWGHLLLGRSFDMQSIIGVISLAGIVVNDSILMMEFIKNNEKNGMDPHVASKQAASDRFRALTLTSLTTIAGLLPLLMEKSLQAQMLIPLALSIVCGLTTSTLLVLLVTPMLYLVVQDFRKSGSRWFKHK
ncbi:MAG: efflux RND transporter permease subunit [Victivallales bacterium]|nr:efflux RND transporter permease subunit [Victivallales bacterium]